MYKLSIIDGRVNKTEPNERVTSLKTSDRKYQAWLLEGNKPEQAETTNEKKQSIILAIRNDTSEQLQSLVFPYSKEERETWFKQEQETKLYTTDNDPKNAPFLSGLAIARDILLPDLVSKVLEKVAIFNTEVAKILGNQQKQLDDLT